MFRKSGEAWSSAKIRKKSPGATSCGRRTGRGATINNQQGMINVQEKRGGVELRQNPQEKPWRHVLRTADGGEQHSIINVSVRAEATCRR